MHLKDYYSILELEPSAALTDIKKAYRKLALQYHPDKNQNDHNASARFTEIKEAYEVLTNPAKKEYYLQQRWYNQSIGKRRTQESITPVSILRQALEVEKYVSRLDVFRMDKPGLKDYLLGLLPDSTVEQLKQFNEPGIIREIITVTLKAMAALTPAYTANIIFQLEKLAAGDEGACHTVSAFVQKTAKKSRREKYSLLLIIVATLVLCLLIFFAGR
ncbi:MAG: DnaJ domain-containing protein [Bacteroidota bacterium]|nr:DnaJ domain-containing protein [Bacteroidota bacterium]